MTLSLPEAQRLADVVIDSGLFAGFLGSESDRKATDRAHARAVVHLLFADSLGLPALDGLTGLAITPASRRIDTRHLAALVQRSGRYRYRYVAWRPDLVHLEWLEREEGASERWWVRCGTGCQAEPRDERPSYRHREAWECDGCKATEPVETLVPAGWVLAGDTRWTIERARAEGRMERDPGRVWERFPRGCLTAAALREGQSAFAPEVLHLGFRSYDDSGDEQESPSAAAELGGEAPWRPAPRGSLPMAGVLAEVSARSCGARGLPASDRVERDREEVLRFRWPSGEWLAWRYSLRASARAQGGEASYMPLDEWPGVLGDLAGGTDPGERTCLLHGPREECRCPRMQDVLRAAGLVPCLETNLRAALERTASMTTDGAAAVVGVPAAPSTVSEPGPEGAVPEAGPEATSMDDGGVPGFVSHAAESGSVPPPESTPSKTVSEGALSPQGGEAPAPASSSTAPEVTGSVRPSGADLPEATDEEFRGEMARRWVEAEGRHTEPAPALDPTSTTARLRARGLEARPRGNGPTPNRDVVDVACGEVLLSDATLPEVNAWLAEQEARDARECPECWGDLVDGRCPKCPSPRADDDRCPDCDARVPDDAPHCPECGPYEDSAGDEPEDHEHGDEAAARNGCSCPRCKARRAADRPAWVDQPALEGRDPRRDPIPGDVCAWGPLPQHRGEVRAVRPGESPGVPTVLVVAYGPPPHGPDDEDETNLGAWRARFDATGGRPPSKGRVILAAPTPEQVETVGAVAESVLRASSPPAPDPNVIEGGITPSLDEIARREREAVAISRRERAARWGSLKTHRATKSALGDCALCGRQILAGEVYAQGLAVGIERKRAARKPVGRAHTACVEVLAQGRDPKAQEATSA